MYNTVIHQTHSQVNLIRRLRLLLFSLDKNKISDSSFSYFLFSKILDMRGSVVMKLMQGGFFFDSELGFVEIPFVDIAYACKVRCSYVFTGGDLQGHIFT